MGSAAALLTFSFYLFNFFCTATTPLVASQRASGNPEKAIQTGGQALSLALASGALLTTVLLVFQQPLLQIMGTTPDTYSYASSFLALRALAAPAVLCISASTGVLRGYLDTKTPIYILVAANMVNLVLDVVLIPGAGLGPLGAAIATTTAEWISALSFLAVLAGALPSAGNLSEKLSVRPSLSIPAWNEVQPLVVASAAVFFRSLVLQVTLSSATAMAARDASASVAAHQIAIQLWLLCSFVADALAAASQALIADALGERSRRRPNDGEDGAVQLITKTIFAYSLALGLFLSTGLGVANANGFLLSFFTADSSTQAALDPVLTLLILSQPLNSLVFAADGVLQGAAEFPFQAKAMLLSGSTAWISFLALEQTGFMAAAEGNTTLLNIWIALNVLQLMRGLTSLVKVIDKNGPINLLASSSDSSGAR